MIESKAKHRFFVLDGDWLEDQLELKDERQVHQILKVLRLRKGDELIVLDNEGFEYQSQIIGEKPLRLKLLTKLINKNEPAQKIVLYQSLIKKDKFEWVLQKGTEVGVSEFVPVMAARSQKRAIGKEERLRSIIQESAEQAGRGKIPALVSIKNLSEVKPSANALNLILDPRAEIPLARHFPAVPGYRQISILVGPEGGFTEDELSAVKAAGWEAVHLGPRILRTETAGVVAAAAILIAQNGVSHLFLEHKSSEK